MARPLRLEFSGALYHLTARGNARADIFVDCVFHVIVTGDFTKA